MSGIHDTKATPGNLFGQVLQHLTQGRYHLKSLELFSYLGTDFLERNIPRLSQAIAACPDLQRISLHLGDPSVNWDFGPPMASLQSLQNLTHLKVEFHRFHIAALRHQDKPFPALRQLDHDSDAIILRLIQLRQPLLSLRRAKLGAETDVDAVNALVLALPQLAPNLTDLSLRIDTTTNTSLEPLRWDDLVDPLLQLHSLRSLHLSNRHPMMGTNDTKLKIMATTWPQMRSLRITALGEELPEPPEDRATFHGLDCFASPCPKLTQLAINARLSPSDIALPFTAQEHHSVRQVSLRIVELQDLHRVGDVPRSVATLIDRLWPNARIGVGSKKDAGFRAWFRRSRRCVWQNVDRHPYNPRHSATTRRKWRIENLFKDCRILKMRRRRMWIMIGLRTMLEKWLSSLPWRCCLVCGWPSVISRHER